MEDVADATQRMMDRFKWNESRSNREQLANGRDSATARIASGHERTWKARRVRRRGSKWRDWNVVTSMYTGACHEGLAG